MSPEYRLILYHKHPSSGRTLFLRLGETVCQFDGLSATSQLRESHVGGTQINGERPDLLNRLRDAEQRLGLAQGSLTLDREFDVLVDDTHVPIQVHLARFTDVDPPHAQLAEQAGKFIALTEARRLLPTELELLRLAYSVIMDD